jgi:hypothetical protein
MEAVIQCIAINILIFRSASDAWLVHTDDAAAAVQAHDNAWWCCAALNNLRRHQKSLINPQSLNVSLK